MRFPWQFAIAAAVAVGAWAWRIPPLPRIATTRPALSPQEAEARLQVLEQRYGGPLLDHCRHRLWHTAARTTSVVVLLHGYTNCPHQFHQLGELLHSQGHAVLAARLPYHGQRNRQPTDLSRMTPAVLADYLGELLAIAHGLGTSVTILGFSFGGVLAGWIAQQRADVDHILLVSASLGVNAIRPEFRRLFARLRPLLPDKWHWWDPERREQKLGPPHGYVGFTLHGVATILRLGEGLIDSARWRKPQCARLTVVLNAADQVVDNQRVQLLAALWRRRGAPVELIELGVEQGLIHDFMDPLQPQQQVEKVYPQVIDWLAPRAT
jgi:alpha-beta hydrolase superfamily lysophospholipase